MDLQSIKPEERSEWNKLEFVLNYLNPCQNRIEKLRMKMRRKLELFGEYQFTVGLDNCGEPLRVSKEEMEKAIANLKEIAHSIGAGLLVLNTQSWEKGVTAQVIVRGREMQSVLMDVRVALIGESQVGKSTLIGAFTKGVKENGKGSARNAILLHQHERKLGFTATVTQHLLSFDSNGKILRKKSINPVSSASKFLSLIDLPGKIKYRNTLLYGLISQSPDYAILMIDPSNFQQTQNQDYLSLIMALNLPVFIVLSKCEKVSSNNHDQVLDFLQSELCKRNKILMEVLNEDDVVLYSKTFPVENIVPVFCVSFKTQKNTDLLVSFFNLLPAINCWDKGSATEFYLEKWFLRKNGTVLCGIMMKGKVRVGQQLLLGPDSFGNFKEITVLCIRVKETEVFRVNAGQFCSFLVKDPGHLRRGMVLIDLDSIPRTSYEFECLIWTIDSGQPIRNIKSTYKPLIYTQTITQCVYIISGPLTIDPNTIMKFRLRFLYHPEYITNGTRIMIKDTFMTALGTITEIKS